jgi:hypothetical protein
MTWRRDKLPELVRAMSGRPRHEALRGHVTELLREGFGAPYDEIAHELYLLDNRGRIDTMWGATVIELKSDLRRELPDVQARMPDYLADADVARSVHRPSPRRPAGRAQVGSRIGITRPGDIRRIHRRQHDPGRWRAHPGDGLIPQRREFDGRTAAFFLTARHNNRPFWSDGSASSE